MLGVVAKTTNKHGTNTYQYIQGGKLLGKLLSKECTKNTSKNMKTSTEKCALKREGNLTSVGGRTEGVDGAVEVGGHYSCVNKYTVDENT